MYHLFLSVPMNISTKLYIFDKLIFPILVYGFEVHVHVISINDITDITAKLL